MSPNGSRPWRLVVLAGATVLGSLVSFSAGSAAASAATEWLCRPGLADDPCTASLATAVYPAEGPARVIDPKDAKDPPIDCFYVYPTVSTERRVTATLAVEPAETNVAISQASRFSQYCQVYAPIYPQITLAALNGYGHVTRQDLEAAYDSVRSAFLDYLAHDNHGRGIVFLGHSQGASILIRLLATQVDPKPAVRRLLVSALLMGGDVTVPTGGIVGGDFQHIPACTSSTETGCVVAYSSFDRPPPADSVFARVGVGVDPLYGQRPDPSLQVLCVNPAAPGGGPADLAPYFPYGPAAVPWITYPDLYRAQCMSAGGATWLQVSSIAGPGDTRPVVKQSIGPTWGLHIDDVNLALGNLVSLVGSESAAYVHANG
ncbi:MAG TPA: DUF3089 domain-containing protein [Acidimicrobiales bacterium]|nr:DUF3089 domain-containing protein [Acidimicrobiales bacterium]